MSALTIKSNANLLKVATDNTNRPASLSVDDSHSAEERVTLLLVRDLVQVGWRLQANDGNSFKFSPPSEYSKDAIKLAMGHSRNEILAKNTDWIASNLPKARKNLASGRLALSSPIIPKIEVCQSQSQRDLFRLYRYYWSSPYSEYVGRRIRLLIRDIAVKRSPVIGIAALGSSIIHIPDRDNWIGWDSKTRTERIIYAMDAYILGALPPYNSLLGGKLIAYLLASNEVRAIFRGRYRDQETLIGKRKASDLALIVTSSLYGRHSSQYNRIGYGSELLYQPIGTTSGFGTLHISGETFRAMKDLIEAKGYIISNRFGDGPNWRMRVIRTACDVLNLDSDVILRHSFQRGLYALQLANNTREFLRGEETKLDYRHLPASTLVQHWKDRWLSRRREVDEVRSEVERFEPSAFGIVPTSLN